VIGASAAMIRYLAVVGGRHLLGLAIYSLPIAAVPSFIV
jgi:hypothetical protein